MLTLFCDSFRIRKRPMMQRDHRSRGPRLDNAGVTLLELMFAAGVLAITLGILFGALVTLNVMGQIAEGRTQASTALAGVLEEVRLLTFDQLIAYIPEPIESAGLDIALLIEVFDADGDPLPLPLAPGGGGNPISSLPNPVEVRATALWSRGGGRIFSSTASTFHGR